MILEGMRMISKVTVLSLIVISVGLLNLTAQVVSVEVFVYDADTDEPIESALVSVLWNGNGIDSAYTDINGIANISIQQPATSVRNQEGLPSSILLSNNYPNPFDDNTNVQMSVPEAQTITASVYNILGQRVASEQVNLSGGDYTLNLSLGHLPMGVYYLRVGGRESQAVKLTKMGSGIHHSGQVFSVSPSNLPGSTTISKVTDNMYILKAVKHDYEVFETSLIISEDSEITVPLTQINNQDPVGVVVDIDGNVYPTVVMGMKDSQGNVNYKQWLAKNLRVTHYRNGDPIPTSADNSQWANLVNNQQGAWTVQWQGAYLHPTTGWRQLTDEEKLEYYGALYTWWAVEEDINGRGLCPEGWHVPTDDEWTQVERYLGTPEEELSPTVNRVRGKRQLVGARLKSTRTGVISAKWQGSPFPDPGHPVTHFRNNAPGADGEIGAHPFWPYPNLGANPNFDNPGHPSYTPVLQIDSYGAENDYDWFDNPDNLNPLDLDQFEEGGYIWKRWDSHIISTISSYTENSITDDSAPFGSTNSKVPWRIHLRSGNGKDQWRTVVANTPNTLTLDEPWDIMPNSGDEYNIYIGFALHAQPSFVTGENFVGNETGLSLVPSGMRDQAGVYGYAQRVLYLWTSTPGRPGNWDDPNTAMVRTLGSNDARVFFSHSPNPRYTHDEAKYQGLGLARDSRRRGVAISVRCLVD
jgi:uncharacterized protein (TIGR02145 family)